MFGIRFVPVSGFLLPTSYAVILSNAINGNANSIHIRARKGQRIEKICDSVSYKRNV